MSSQTSSRLSFVRDQPPVTYTFVAIAVALQIAVWVYPDFRPDDAKETRRRLGAVTELRILQREVADKPRKQIPQLFGPFDLWKGELWRVPVSGFHHVNLWHKYNPLHLIMNCLAIAFMGGILERRMGRWPYALFFLSAVIVSSVPELLMSQYGMGLSGGAYALFGFLVVLNQSEEVIADQLPPSFLPTGFVWLFLCMALTYFDALAVANEAHVAGLIYGWIFGQAFYIERHWSSLGKTAFLAGHLLLIPAGYFLMHPFWLGTYHWYKANEVRNFAKDEAANARRIYHLEQAVERDPSLQIPWRQLTEHYVFAGDRQRGWRTILRGMDYNRSDDKAVKLSKKIWRSFRTPDERWQALQTLKSVFGEYDRDWQYRLGIRHSGQQRPSFTLAFEFGLPRPDVHLPQHEAERDLRRLFIPKELEARDLSAPQVDPQRSDSAVEGVAL